MQASRRLAVVMLFALIIPSAISGIFPVALAQEDPTFDTGESFYKPGDTVYFEGSGFDAEVSYTITVTLPDDSTTGIPFTADAEGNIPADTSMAASQKGTYAATVEEVDIHFGVWGTNKEEYLYPDTVSISGGGMYDSISFDINIVNGSDPPVEVLSDVFDANSEGVFSYDWVLDESLGDGTYTITLSGTGTCDSEAETFELVTTIVLFVTVEARAEYVLGEIEAKQDEIMGYVEEEETRITDIEGALIAKLRNTAKKIEQAIAWLGTSKDKVARNMLKAAWNKLKAFINQVRAQTGKHIEAGVAGELIEQAETLQGLIQGMRDDLAPSPSSEESSTELSVGNGNNGKGKAKGHWKHSWKGNGKGKGKAKGKPT